MPGEYLHAPGKAAGMQLAKQPNGMGSIWAAGIHFNTSDMLMDTQLHFIQLPQEVHEY